LQGEVNEAIMDESDMQRDFEIPTDDEIDLVVEYHALVKLNLQPQKNGVGL